MPCPWTHTHLYKAGSVLFAHAAVGEMRQGEREADADLDPRAIGSSGQVIQDS